MARYVVLLCVVGAPDCSQSAQPPRSGTWTGAIPVAVGTTYALSLSVNPTAKTFTFGISGEGIPTQTGTVDASAMTAPFTPELSAASFLSARLLTQVGGGLNTTGETGSGSVTARFDDVTVGMAGGAAASFDDFASGTRFDPTRWSIGVHRAQVVASTLELALDQKDSPATVGVGLRNTAASALQVNVTVPDRTSNGSGRIAAKVRQALYNDGSPGSAAPHLNSASSYVGDVHASIGMTDAEVFYEVLRCDTVLCDEYTYVQPATRIATVTPGTTHALYVDWDSQHRLVLFQLDGDQAVAFDPVAAGFAVAAAPSVPMKRIAVEADASAPGDRFTTGSAGVMTAVFDDVKTN